MKLPRRPTRITPAFGIQYVKRSLQECLSDRDARDFGQRAMDETVGFVKQLEDQPACVYCGSRDVKRWDHVIAVSEFGQTALGNLVLACAACDDSKGSRPFDQWMRGAAAKSPTSRGVPDVEERVRRVRGFMELHSTRRADFEERLNEVELRELRDIHRVLDSVYSRANRLVDDYRKRTGAA